MKALTLTAFLAGMVIVPLIFYKRKRKLLPIFLDQNKRYDINEYLTEQGL